MALDGSQAPVCAPGFPAGLFVALLIGAAAAWADEPRAAFRPCIDPNNLPFSNSQGEGIENKIAEVFAKALGLPVQSYASPQRMNFVRNTLRYRLPGTDYRCDILMGVPSGYDQAWTTAPYYRSTYVLVFPKGKGLDAVKTGDDLFTLFEASKGKPVIGIYDRSPGSIWLVKHGWEEQARPYRMLTADPEQYRCGDRLGPDRRLLREADGIPGRRSPSVRARRQIRLRDGDGCALRGSRMEIRCRKADRR